MAGMYFAGSSVFTGFATGTILVVAAAMLGSVTVVPAVLRWLGDRVEKGRVPFLAKWRDKRQARGANGAWGWILDRVLARPVVSAVLVGRRPHRAGDPGLRACTRPRSAPTRCRAACRSCRPTTGSRRRSPVGRARGGRGPGRRRHRQPVTAQLKELEHKALASGQFKRPISMTVSPNRHVAVLDIPMVGSGTDAQSDRALADAARWPRARDHGRRCGASRRFVTGQTAAVEGLQRPDEVARAVRVRVRAAAGLRAAAGDVPLDRDPDQGDRAQPAVGRRRLRRAGARLPAPGPRACSGSSPRAASPRGCRCSCS